MLRGSAGELVAVENEKKMLSTEATKRSSPHSTRGLEMATPESTEIPISTVAVQAQECAHKPPRGSETTFAEQNGDASSACLMAEMEAIVNARVAALSRDTEQNQEQNYTDNERAVPVLPSKQTSLSIKLEGHDCKQQQEHQQTEHEGHSEHDGHDEHKVCEEKVNSHSEQITTNLTIGDKDRTGGADLQAQQKVKMEVTYIESEPIQQLSLTEVEIPNSSMPPVVANFVGRIATLGKMRSSLSAYDRLIVFALLGPVGSGKSALMSEYLHLYSESYSFVWWFKAGTGGQMEDGLRRYVCIFVFGPLYFN